MLHHLRCRIWPVRRLVYIYGCVMLHDIPTDQRRHILCNACQADEVVDIDATFPCVVDACPYLCSSVYGLNEHSRERHLEPWTGSDGITRMRYPGADSAGDFRWHEAT